MLTHISESRIHTLADLMRGPAGRALLEELDAQHADLLAALQDSETDTETHRLQGACRAITALKRALSTAPETSHAYNNQSS